MQCFDMVELAVGMDLPHEVTGVDSVWLRSVSVRYSHLPTILRLAVSLGYRIEKGVSVRVESFPR